MRNFQESLNTKKFAPIYLFYGDEALLIDEAMAALRQAVLPEENDWNREVFDGAQVAPDELVTSAQAINFLGGNRLVIAKGIEWLGATAAKGGEVDFSGLIAYLADPNPDSVIALTAANIDKRRAIVKAIQKKGQLVECTTPKGGAKDIWLAQRFKSRGKQADKKALELISLSAANLSQMALEVEKLCLYVGDSNQITLADAEAVVSKSSIFSIFELTDAAAAKNATQAVAAYRNLVTQGEEEQKILVMLANQFRNMLLVQDMQRQGYPVSELPGILQLHPYVVEKCSRQVRGFSQAQLIKALEILLAADIANKSGDAALEPLLETAILRICAF